MELGKRILLNVSGRPKFKGIIVEIGVPRTSGQRFKVKFFDRFNPSGNLLTCWYSEHSLEMNYTQTKDLCVSDQFGLLFRRFNACARFL